MSRIVLTFKNNDKEKAIESFLDSKVSATAYIKELVWEAMNNGTITVPVKSDVQKPEQIQQEQQQEEVTNEVAAKPKKKVGGFGKK